MSEKKENTQKTEELALLPKDSIEHDERSFALRQREAQALMSGTMIPDQYKNNVGNCLLALDYARQIRQHPLTVMSHLHIIKGRPSWDATFLIGMINASGLFDRLKFKFNRNDQGGYITKEFKYRINSERNPQLRTVSLPDISCFAYTKEKDSGEELIGTTVTTQMILEEGWYDKDGSKWKTMSDQMFMYRAAAFWSRTFASDITNGLHITSEIEDAHVIDITPSQDVTDLSDLNGKKADLDLTAKPSVAGEDKKATKKASKSSKDESSPEDSTKEKAPEKPKEQAKTATKPIEIRQRPDNSDLDGQGNALFDDIKEQAIK